MEYHKVDNCKMNKRKSTERSPVQSKEREVKSTESRNQMRQKKKTGLFHLKPINLANHIVTIHLKHVLYHDFIKASFYKMTCRPLMVALGAIALYNPECTGEYRRVIQRVYMVT